MRFSIVLAVLAVALGAAGLYRYESTRTVNCGTSAATPVGGNLNDYLDRIVPRDTQGLQVFRIVCQSRIDAVNGQAQGAYPPTRPSCSCSRPA